MRRYFDRAGRPLSLVEWLRVASIPGARDVAHAELSNGVCISTVWVGFDPNDWPSEYDTGAAPRIFESLVTHQDLGHREFSYFVTERDALAGHHALCAKWRPWRVSRRELALRGLASSWRELVCRGRRRYNALITALARIGP